MLKNYVTMKNKYVKDKIFFYVKAHLFFYIFSFFPLRTCFCYVQVVLILTTALERFE